MPHQLYCPLGHRWNTPFLPTAAPPACPECGQVAQGVVPELPSFHPLDQVTPITAPADPAVTIWADSKDRSADGSPSSGDRTIAPDLAPGQVGVARTDGTGYEILEEIGRGGMGVVYKARHRKLNRLVALKMILSGPHAGAGERARFQAEAETLAPLRHPNIVQIYEVGELDGHPYLALELIEGGNLAQHLAGNPQPGRRAAELLEPLVRGVHFAHERGIVHRDLKPANILLQPVLPTKKTSGAEPPVFVAKVTDFGLAKRFESHTGTTRTGAVVGTPGYISPEQAAGKKEVGPAADVYALGAILYEILTGRPPFKGETAMDTMLQVMNDEPLPPRRLQPKVPIDLETICLKCLTKEPERRYASAEALAEDLRRFRAGEPIHARPAGPLERALKWAHRRPTAAALVAVSVAAVIALLTVGGAYLVLLQQSNDAAVTRANELSEEKATLEAAATALENEKKKALEAAADADKQRRIALDKVDLSRRSLYALELIQAAGLVRRQPGVALELLDDADRFPADLRKSEYTWAQLRRQADRHRGDLTGAKGAAPALAVAAGGDLLASAGADPLVYLLNPRNPAAPARPFPHRHIGPVVAAAFSPDGRTLATAGFDKTIKLFDCSVDPVKPIVSLTGHEEGVRTVAFSPDGLTLASGGFDRTVRLWDVATRAVKATLRGHTGAINAVAFSPDGKLLASGSVDGTVRLWDGAGVREAADWVAPHGSPVGCLTWTPGAALFSGGDDGVIAAWDVEGKKRRATLRGHLKAVQTLAFLPGSGLLASGGGDGTVRLWQPTAGEEKVCLTRRTGTAAVAALAAVPGTELFAAAGPDEHIDLWDGAVEPPPRKFTLGTTPGQPPLTTLAPGRRLVSVARAERVVRTIELDTQQERVAVQGFAVPIESVALSPNGQWLALGGEDGLVRLYFFAPNGRLLLRGTLTTQTGAVRCLAFAADGNTLVSGGDDGHVKFWDVGTNAEKAVRPPALKGPVTCLALAGNRLACGGKESAVFLWDVGQPSTAPVRLRVPAAPRTLEFAPDGASLAVVGANGSLRIWDAVSKEERPTTFRQVRGVRSVAFSPDGKTLATGHEDWTVHLWDAVAGQERGVVASELWSTPVHAVTFSLDGQWLFSLGDDGSLRRR